MMEIDYPYHIDARGRTATTGFDDHVRDLLEQLLFTSPGERVNRPDFGGDLLELVFAPVPEVEPALRAAVSGAIQRWLGDLVLVEALEVVRGEGSLQLLVSYLVRNSQERRTERFERGLP
jgi:phage baseplate assembly protein W